eukprot:3772075-Alexandrium_andersonii.AAC.1
MLLKDGSPRRTESLDTRCPAQGEGGSNTFDGPLGGKARFEPIMGPPNGGGPTLPALSAVHRPRLLGAPEVPPQDGLNDLPAPL